MIVETTRVEDTDNPGHTFVQRIKNGGFETLKEVRTTTGESIVEGNEMVTTETITITRYIGEKINNFPNS